MNPGNRIREEYVNFPRKIPVCDEADVIVAGGGPAGIAAAISAARLGCSVYLVEQGTALGGMGTIGGVNAFATASDGIRLLARGVFEEVVGKLFKCGGISSDISPENWYDRFLPFDGEKLKQVYDEMVKESNVSVVLYTRVIDTVTVEGRIDTVVLSGPEGVFGLKARMFVDATGDATLSCLAGVPFKVGDENGNTQAPTLCACYTGVDWDRYREFLISTGQQDDLKKTLALAFADNAFRIKDMHLPGASRTGENTAFINAGHVYGADCVTSKGLTAAVMEGRKLVREYLAFYRKYVPGFENAVLVWTGSMLGVRETRRITGRYVLNVDDFLARRSFHDEIGRYSYAIDVHESSPSVKDHEEFIRDFYSVLRYGKGESYGIPYRSLVPENISNLLVAGRCISTDRKMQGSVRVMPCCFITGQAAGTAAALCVRMDIPAEKLECGVLRSTLKDAGAYLP